MIENNFANIKKKNSPLKIGNTTISPGEKITIALPTPELYTCIPMHIPIHVIHGKKKGPILLISSALHGDEMNGIAIIQKLLNFHALKSLYGTLIIIPVINVYGLMTHSRNLPDRKDLESSFPGSEKGSFAARLAYSLNKEIFDLATHIVHIQTGEPHYYKFPQIHTNTNNEKALNMAKSFNIPFISHTDSDKGFFWKMKENEDVAMIVYEGGKALSLDEQVIRIGFNGIIKIMRAIGLINPKLSKSSKSIVIKSSKWILSNSSGIAKILTKPGSLVKENETIAIVTDPFGTKQTSTISSPYTGVILGTNTLPLINEGDPLVKIAPILDKEIEEIKNMYYAKS